MLTASTRQRRGDEPGGLAGQVIALGEVGCLVGRLGAQPCRRRQVVFALVEVRRHRGVAGQEVVQRRHVVLGEVHVVVQ